MGSAGLLAQGCGARLRPGVFRKIMKKRRIQTAPAKKFKSEKSPTQQLDRSDTSMEGPRSMAELQDSLPLAEPQHLGTALPGRTKFPCPSKIALFS